MSEHTEQAAPTAGADSIETSCHAMAVAGFRDRCTVAPHRVYVPWGALKAVLRFSGITEADIARRLRERAELGKERYGQYLTPGNGRDARRDLQEELLDAAAYMAQVEAEAGK